jgi:adenosylcobyric acid synthase
MLQGTGSSVGKSLLVAGLCRALKRRGLNPVPFKPQNMSNNAAVTPDGGEIGRAQALQALACGLAPSTDMNPVLLKPQNGASQIVVQGRIHGQSNARDYQSLKPTLMPYVLESFDRLACAHDIVLVEGAGSASEINLRANDIANMGFALARNVPVILVGDIDRGGVIAALVGTHTVLPPADRAAIRGFIVNRMRGDLTLFEDGMRAIAAATAWPALGLVPHFPDAARLPREDALDLLPTNPRPKGHRQRIAVPLLPHIANFDDFDPLEAEPTIDLLLLPLDRPLPGDTDLVILPGSKSTIADLHALQAAGWHHDLHAHHRRGGRILGLCAGLQMLGRTVDDPHGIEGRPGQTEGLALLDIETELTTKKNLRAVTGHTLPDNVPITGYEMHLGVTTGPDRARPFAHLDDGTVDGARSPDGLVAGTYLHGLFANDRQRAAWLGAAATTRNHDDTTEAILDAFADHLETHIDIDALLAISSR